MASAPRSWSADAGRVSSASTKAIGSPLAFAIASELGPFDGAQVVDDPFGVRLGRTGLREVGAQEVRDDDPPALEHLGTIERARESSPAIPTLVPERSILTALLRAFVLDKAMYELAYEINHRPDWVRIPLTGIVKLLE